MHNGSVYVNTERLCLEDINYPYHTNPWQKWDMQGPQIRQQVCEQ